MSALFTLTEATIRALASPESFARGREYLARGAVARLTRRGDQVQAEVEGSAYAPYQVRVTLGPAGVGETDCTCPYEWGGACKHIVATLLALLHHPEQVEDQPSLTLLLSDLDRDQLQAILLALADRRPELADLIAVQVAAVRGPASEPSSAGAKAPRSRRTAVDPAPFRRQTRAALHSLDRMRSSDAYWHVGGVVAEVRALAEQARPFIEAGDGRDALSILQAVTEEYLAGWLELDDSDGYAGELFEDLDPLWAEAILSADLSPAERESWAERFAAWAGEVEDYGPEAFGTAEAAAVQGWDEPSLQRVLRGEEPAAGAARAPADDEEDEDAWYADELAVARLNVLERQGRFAEYLNLARAEGQAARYVTMLVRLGRTREAAEEGLASLGMANEALTLARALHEHGAIDDALRVGAHGLTLQQPRLALARWLRDAAAGASRTEPALEAALAAVRESLQLADYLAVEPLAGAAWPSLKEELLARARRADAYSAREAVEILLHAGRIEDAIALADASHDGAVVERVADAARDTDPQWVIRACRAQAEPIMDGGLSKHYQEAARWLARARDAYLAAGHDDEWPAYLEGLMDRHHRKYTLVPLLEGLQ